MLQGLPNLRKKIGTHGPTVLWHGSLGAMSELPYPYCFDVFKSRTIPALVSPTAFLTALSPCSRLEHSVQVQILWATTHGEKHSIRASPLTTSCCLAEDAL